jgi:hypothetical protein
MKPDLPDQLPSDRAFGLQFAVVFAVLAAYFHHTSGLGPLPLLFVCLSLVTLVATSCGPGLLRPFNRAWFMLGLLLGRIVSPVVIGAIFFLVITPLALVMRVAVRDALRLRKRAAPSFWITRNPAGPEPDSFTNQF